MPVSKYGLIYHDKNITELQSVQMANTESKNKMKQNELAQSELHLERFCKITNLKGVLERRA